MLCNRFSKPNIVKSYSSSHPHAGCWLAIETPLSTATVAASAQKSARETENRFSRNFFSKLETIGPRPALFSFFKFRHPSQPPMQS